MAALCSAINCICCGLRPCCQSCNQCINTCGCGNRKVFYNFDGSIGVEPLVSYFKPTNSLARENLIKGMSLDKKVLKKGLTAVEQIAAVVNYASKNNLSARAVGTGSSWSRITTVRDILIDMTNLDRILDAKPQNSVSSVYHIEVQAGMKLKDFARAIDNRYGMALPSTTPYGNQTMGGVVSTSTHGPGQDIQTMSNFVVSLHMVIAKGVQVKLKRPVDGDIDEDFDAVKCKIECAKYGDPPLELCSTDIFRAAAVGLGCLGIIYSVTFECIQSYNIKETRHQMLIKWPSKKHTKRFKIPSDLKEIAGEPGKYLTIVVNPYPQEALGERNALTSGYLLGERTDERNTRVCQCQCCFTDCQCQKCCGFPDWKFQIFWTDCAANCAQSMANCFPSCIPNLNTWGMSQVLRTQDTTDVGKWYNILGYFTSNNVRATEGGYFMPLRDMDKAIADIIQIMQEYLDYRVYSILPLYIRMVKADDLFLSPVNRNRGDGSVVEQYFTVDVPFFSGAYGIEEFHKKIEDHLFTKYQARPHWAKNMFLSLDRVSQLYPDLDKWKRVYLLFNSDGTFDNEFTRKIGFEDFRSSSRLTDQHPLPTVSVLTQQQVVYAKVSHEDHHHHVVRSEVTSSKVISSQPKKSEDLPNTFGKSHFKPIPLSQYRK